VKGLAILSVAALALGAAVLPVRAAPDGATVFARCAACHTKTGQGVPGAYPPLNADFRALAAKDAGRRYIVLAVTRGLMGPVTVEGKPYAGVMPAQAGLDDASVAAVLNHVGTAISKTGPAFRAFSEGEVKTLRASGAGLAPGDVAKLHEPAGGK
jgi:mono/diheme cytochrome c family protein